MSMYFISTPGDGRAGLLKIVNVISEKNYTLDELDFSTPQRNDTSLDSRNTKVDLFFKTEKGNYGKKTLFYNRAHVSDLPILTINRGGATTYHDIIDTINSVYRLFLTTNDIINGPLPNIVDNIITVTLPVSPNSFKLYDGDLIEVDPFEPQYNIYRPEDTLINYLCMGEDKWAEYHDTDGRSYRLLVEINSYDCGYSDFNPRIKMTSPSLNILEEDETGEFTLEYINPNYPVTVTFNAPGLTVTPNSITLDENNITTTFTVRSNNPGKFNLAITNAQGVINPAPVKINVIDRWQSSYLVIPPDLSRVVKGIPTGDFTVIGYQIDGDEPVTVTIHTPGDLSSSVDYVVLTKDLNVATFTVQSPTVSNFQLSFTNNRSLDNPNPINVFVLDPGTLSITPPSEPIVNDIQSLPFTVTLAGGIDEIVVTPVFTGTYTVSPSSFILSPGNRTAQFRVTYQGQGSNSLSLTNDDYAVNPASYDFTVLPKPVITVTVPTDPILSGVTSPPFTISIANPYKPVVITLTSNVDTLSKSTITLGPDSTSTTFTVLDSQGGNYYISFNNNSALANPPTVNFGINQVYNTSYSLSVPSNLNLRIGQNSGNFTITGQQIDPNNPLIVDINPEPGLTASKSSVTLTPASNSSTFTVLSNTEDTYQINYTNNRGLTNPSPTSVNVIDPGTIVVTPPETDILTGTYSGDFTVTLVGGHSSTLVSFGSSGATFNKTTLTLSPANPTGTFRVRYSSGGNKTITFSNNINAINPAPYAFTVHNVPSISIVAPIIPIFRNVESSNFTITGTNIYKPVIVFINKGTIDNITFEEVTLTPSAPSATFRITENTAGSYSLGFTNNQGWAITNSLTFSVTEYSEPVLQLTGPSGNLWSNENSGNFTITLVNGVENVTVTVVTDADVVSNYTHTLGPGNLSRTFTVRYNQPGTGNVAITNNKDYLNPNSIDVSILDRPNMVVSWTKNNNLTVYRNIAHVFTVSISDIWKTVNVTPTFTPNTGISASPSNRNLSSSTPSGTFNITASVAGQYVIGLNNNQSLNIPNSITIDVINGHLELRVPTGDIEMGSETDWFELEMFNYTLNTIVEISLTNFNDGTVIIDPTDVYQTTKILLTNSNRIARFKLLKNTTGTCSLTITNNQQLDNPIAVDIVFLGVPYLTLMYSGQTNEILSRQIGPFSISLNDGIESVIVTPGFTTSSGGTLTSVPETISLTAPEDTDSFSISANAPGQYNLVFSNDKDILNPPITIINFYPVPTINLVTPSWPDENGFFIDEETANFTISLTDASVVDIGIIITIDSALEFVKTPFGWDGTKAILNSTIPSITFSVKANSIGNYNIAITNDKGLTNPAIYTLPILERSSLALGLYAPEIINIEQNKISDSFTIRLLGSMQQDVEVFPVGDNNLVFNPASFTLNQTNKIATFTVTSTVPGTYQISIDNSSGVENLPNVFNFTFRLAAQLLITNVPITLSSGDISNDITVELVNAFEAVEITPVSDGGVFNKESFILDIDNLQNTFTVQYNNIGTKIISFNTSVEFQNPSTQTLTVIPNTDTPFITLDIPETGIYESTLSGNFSLTLHNGPWYGYEPDGVTVSENPWVPTNNLLLNTADNDIVTADKTMSINLPFIPIDVNVNINSNTGVYDKTSFILNAGDNVETFKITPESIGTFTIDVTNDSSIANPPTSTFTVNSFISISMSEIEDLLQWRWSSPVEVSCIGIDRITTVIPVSDTAGVEFDPAIVVIGPSNPTGTFKVRSTVDGTIDVGTINNQDIRNPVKQFVEIAESDQYFDYTDYLLTVNDAGVFVNDSVSALPVSVSGTFTILNDSSLAPFPNETPYFFNISSTLTAITTTDNSIYNPFNNSIKEFTLEFYLKNTRTNAKVVLVDFRDTVTFKYSAVIYLDYTNRTIKIFDKFTNGIVYETETNSIPVNGSSSPWFQITIEYVNGVLSFYTNGENQNVIKKVGSFTYQFPDANAGRVRFFRSSSGLSESVTGFIGYVDSVRYTSKARYNGVVPLMVKRHTVTESPYIRLYEPNDVYLDKNVISKDFTINGRNLTENVVVTPYSNISNELLAFIPESVIISPASPTATFKVVSNYVGAATIGISNDKNILSRDMVNIHILDIDPLYDNVIFNMVPDGTLNSNSTIDKSKRTATVSPESDVKRVSRISKHGKSWHVDEATNAESINVSYTGLPYALDIGAGDFTIEGSVALSAFSTDATDSTLVDFRNTSNESFKIFINRQTNKMFVYSSRYLIPINETPATLPAPNVLFDYAVEYVSGVITIYINGQYYASNTDTIIPKLSGGTFRLLTNYNGNTGFYGWFDRIRITKDAYRYGGPYTPSPLPYSGSGEKIITIIRPSNLKLFDTETSENFTISVTNIKNTCVITPHVDVPGLTITPSPITLTKSTLSKTFKVSGNSGNYNITFKNNLLIDFEESVNVAIFDSLFNKLDLIEPEFNQAFINQNLEYSLRFTNPVDTEIKTELRLNPSYQYEHINNVVVDLDFQDIVGATSTYDWSGNTDLALIFRGSAVISNERAFNNGKSSMKLIRANGAGIEIRDNGTNSILDRTGDFIIEIEFFLDSIVSIQYLLNSVEEYISIDGSGSLTYEQNGYSGSNRYVKTANNVIKINTHYNLCVSRKNERVYIYVNGIIRSTSSDVTPFNEPILFTGSNKAIALGGYRNGDAISDGITGYINRFRITNGVGKEPQNFTHIPFIYPTISNYYPILNNSSNEIPLIISSTTDIQYQLLIFNDRKLPVISNVVFGFNKVPTINLSVPSITLIPNGDYSYPFTISLTDPGYVPIVIDLVMSSNLNTEDSITQFTLDINTPSIDFSLTSIVNGDYTVSLISNKGINNNVPFNVTVKEKDIVLIGPNINNTTYVNEASFDLTIQTDIAYSDTIVRAQLSAGLSFSDEVSAIKEKDFVLNKDNLFRTFKIIGSTIGEESVSIYDSSDVLIQTLIINVINRTGIPTNLPYTNNDIYLVDDDKLDSFDIDLYQNMT